MTDTGKETDAANDPEHEAVSGEGDPAATAVPPEEGAPEPETLDISPEEEKLATLETENAELKDRLMRALAEIENVRRRADKDRQDAAKFGPSGLAKEMLPAIDNLGRAISAIPAEARDAQDDAVKNLVMGVEMIEKQFVEALARFQIQRIDPAGEKFSYDRHQAMSEAEGTGHPPGTVVQVLQPGYIMHDRLLRPAMVVVAKGDPNKGAGGSGDGSDGHQSIDTTA